MKTNSTISKLRTHSLVWTVGLAAITSAAQALAQSNEMRVNVPFCVPQRLGTSMSCTT